VIAPEGPPRTQVLQIRSDTRVKLVSAIARGRQWLSEIEAGVATIDGIAAREACSKRHVNMAISLAFLAPSLVKAAVEGRLPHGIGVARLTEVVREGARRVLAQVLIAEAFVRHGHGPQRVIQTGVGLRPRPLRPAQKSGLSAIGTGYPNMLW
jgi:hypothetical protein